MSQYDYFASTRERSATELEAAFTKDGQTLFSYLLNLHALDCRNGSEVARKVHQDACHLKAKSFPNGSATKLRAELRQAQQTMSALGLVGISSDAAGVLLGAIQGAVVLEFDFTLEKKLISRDDAVFYPIENPIRKDRIFQVPMTPGSSWKGSLRSAAVELLLNKSGTKERVAERLALVDIFGDEKGDDSSVEDAGGVSKDRSLAAFLTEEIGVPGPIGRRKARLRCLPTYYDQIELDILNPRNRESRAGTLPIVMETVPAGAKGRFSAIYCPFDVTAKPAAEIATEVGRDWKIIGAALHRMLRVSGFGAKKSSGCGKAKSEIGGFRFECSLPGLKPFVLKSLEELPSIHSKLEIGA